MKKLIAILAASALSLTASLQATIVFDQSVDTTGASFSNTYSNRTAYQNFAESVTLDADALITGMDIYTMDIFPDLGAQVTIRIWSDLAGLPDPSSLVSFVSLISEIDTEGTTSLQGHVRVHADFGANAYQALAGQTFWIGMSGTGYELGQDALHAPGNGQMVQFSGTSYSHTAGVGDAAIRLHSEQNSSPVPDASSTLVLMGLSLTGLAVARRRR